LHGNRSGFTASREVAVEIIIAGLLVALCAATWLVYRLTAVLRDRP
jgi:hypothetical protein